MIHQIDIQLKEQLVVEELTDFIQDERCGANNVFIGKVRNHNNGEQVCKLTFEAYEPMAIKELQKIAERTLSLFDVYKLSIHHALGEKTIGDLAVVIAVATPHRKQGFEACEYVIDELKKTVPIWKKEALQNGHVWVSAHP
ncbi:molybdenum cofactor biosynthesis protein MoaE [Persicobacter psychrovividus]|uniref:Molybdopterin synthase catalytic subunit n=1 Tax=Persicobacter psychrovividus TaxID=387638 RepID=A0ABN6LB83_9BACT|nr:molybdenum cofactor biosynthesis protein MoaE [Persicobacter psychrovividus]